MINNKTKYLITLLLAVLTIVLLVDISYAVLISNEKFIGKVEYTSRGTVVQGYDREANELSIIDQIAM